MKTALDLVKEQSTNSPGIQKAVKDIYEFHAKADDALEVLRQITQQKEKDPTLEFGGIPVSSSAVKLSF